MKRFSDDAVIKATGKNWSDWFSRLDTLKVSGLTQKEIVVILEKKKMINSFWWRQTVAREYLHEKGSIVQGQTATRGFQVGVQKSFPVSKSKAWKIITTPPVRDAWLGKTKNLTFKKGHTFKASNGTTGEIRSVEKGALIRLTWKPANRKSDTTLQVRVLENKQGSAIKFHHEKLTSQSDREKMRKHWKSVLAYIEENM